MPVPSRAIASFARRVVRRSRTTRDRCGAVARCAAVDRFTDAPRTAVALLMASDVWATADIVRSFGARACMMRAALAARRFAIADRIFVRGSPRVVTRRAHMTRDGDLVGSYTGLGAHWNMGNMGDLGREKSDARAAQRVRVTARSSRRG